MEHRRPPPRRSRPRIAARLPGARHPGRRRGPRQPLPRRTTSAGLGAASAGDRVAEADVGLGRGRRPKRRRRHSPLRELQAAPGLPPIGCRHGRGGPRVGGEASTWPMTRSSCARPAWSSRSTDVAAPLPGARAAIAALGGYVSGSDAYDQGESRWATVTYRVPVDRFGEAIDALRGLSDRVVRESTQSARGHGHGHGPRRPHRQPARLGGGPRRDHGSRRAHRRRPRRADCASRTVRGQIEQLEAQRSHLADQAALSTLTVTLVHAGRGRDRGAGGLGPRQPRSTPPWRRRCEALQGLAGLVVWLAVVAVPARGLPLLAARACCSRSCGAAPSAERRRLERRSATAGPAAADVTTRCAARASAGDAAPPMPRRALRHHAQVS